MTRPEPTPAEGPRGNLSLEDQLCDQLAELSDMCLAYRALECLVSPQYADEEHENVPISREALGALLHVLNAEMQRRMEAYERTALAIQAQADEGGTDAP
ncbi:hypothetical protein [Hydrogenophaga sp.]|uniref:hypothetical protein n=1 Tax=Hydrogenophaga sp. TaxID=1904254 RepID=UPI00271FF486|nr:hypothetical protein [Hydrogenophaga sp.]MDO9434280.1 hypothetical protein [Hydrogenophaga sp.]